MKVGGSKDADVPVEIGFCGFCLQALQHLKLQQRGANEIPQKAPAGLSIIDPPGEKPKIQWKSLGVPYGIRTRVAAVKGRRPRPRDEGDARQAKR